MLDERALRRSRIRWLPGFQGDDWEATRAREEISHRAGDLASFLRRMLDRLRNETVVSEAGVESRPLAGYHLEGESSWLAGLLEAWATVGEVLSFYQERIANESYLATAREELSIRELVRLIDYVRFPGVAGSGHLAFSIYDLPDMPEAVAVPAGTGVLSIPVKTELPQTWETVEEIVARADWNELRPLVPRRQVDPFVTGASLSLAVAGAIDDLEPGSPLLVAGGAEDDGLLVVRKLAGAEVAETGPNAPPSTLVSWEGELATEERDRRFTEPRLYALTETLPLFGHDAPAWDEVAAEVKAEVAPLQGGVLRAGAGARTWDSLNAGLQAGTVTALLAAPDGSLFAGTENGIFRSLDGATWRRSGPELVGTRVETLASDGQSLLFAGTEKAGVLRSADGDTWEVLIGESTREPLIPLTRRDRPRSGRLPISPVRALLPMAGRVFAGTDHGVFVFESVGDRWSARNEGLPGTSPKTGRSDLVVRSLAPGRRPDHLFAGTDKGVFFSKREGRRWRSRSAGLPGFDPDTGECKVSVLALLSRVDPGTGALTLVAGTDKGFFRSANGGESWEAASSGLPGADLETGVGEIEIRSLVLASDPLSLETRVYAATAEGLFGSDDLGDFWRRVPGELPAREVSALGAAADGRLLAGVPIGGFAERDWPGFHLRDGQIDLASLAPEISAGDWAALIEEGPEGELRAAPFRVLAASPAQRRDFSLAGQITRVLPDRPIPGLERFDLRRAVLAASPRALEPLAGMLPVVEPLPAALVPLDLSSCAVTAFEGPRLVQVVGKPLRFRAAGDEPLALETAAGESVELDPGSELQVLPSAKEDEGGGSLRARRADGVGGRVRVDPPEIEWRPARADDAEVAVRVTAVWSEASGGPALELSPRLDQRLDPATVRILANVAEASQGKSVPMDVLGSGDAARPFQSFRLKVPPLTHLRTWTPRGFASTLEVRVNGVLWREVESLYDAGPRDRVYMVRPDRDGVPVVHFGDGTHGAIPPSGHENVVATYRSGLWTDPVEANKLRILESAPLGVKEVTNPEPAIGGRGPETADETRWRAPLSTRTLGRIVSLQDYEDFCRAFAGVGRARARPLETDSGSILQITLATEDGRPFAAGDPFHRALLAALDAARPGRSPVSVDFCRRVPIALAAEIFHDPEMRAARIRDRVRRLLVESFPYRESRFGARISAAAVRRAIEGVAGVTAVRLEAFYRRDRPAALEPFLEAAPARWSRRRGAVVAAELLELQRPGDAHLRMVAAT